MRHRVAPSQAKSSRQGERDRREALGTDILREHKGMTFILGDESEVPVGAAVAPVRIYVPDGNGGLKLKETVPAVEFRARGGSLSRYQLIMSRARGRAVSRVKRNLRGRPRPKTRWGTKAAV